MSAAQGPHGIRWQGFILLLDALAVLLVVLFPLYLGLRWLKRGQGITRFR